MACTAVDLVAAQDGIDAARCLYQRMLKGPSPGGAFFRHIIALEQAQGEAGAEQSKRVKRLFEVCRVAMPYVRHRPVTSLYRRSYATQP